MRGQLCRPDSDSMSKREPAGMFGGLSSLMRWAVWSEKSLRLASKDRHSPDGRESLGWRYLKSMLE